MAAVAKVNFEKDKEKILKDLPDNVKSMFGVMGFAMDEVDDDEEDEDYKPAAEVEWVPVLIVSPYSVPPRPVRDVYWFDLYSKSKRSKKLAELDYLVYHYGKDDPTDCYSFIPQDEFTSWESGVEAGYDKLPAYIQAKIDAGDSLTEDEEERVRGIREMEEDALKPAEERKRGSWQFKERHEMMSDSKEPPAKRRKK